MYFSKFVMRELFHSRKLRKNEKTNFIVIAVVSFDSESKNHTKIMLFLQTVLIPGKKNF